MRAPASADNDRRELLRLYESLVERVSDLELMALLAERAAELAQGDTERFVLALGAVILNQRLPRTALFAGVWDRFKVVLGKLGWRGLDCAYPRFGSSGFAAKDQSNQVQHFWYFAAAAYEWGRRPVEALAWYHEWNPPGLLRWLPGSGMGRGTALDLALSRQAIDLGRRLADDAIALAAVGDWMRRELG